MSFHLEPYRNPPRSTRFARLVYHACQPARHTDIHLSLAESKLSRVNDSRFPFVHPSLSIRADGCSARKSPPRDTFAKSTHKVINLAVQRLTIYHGDIRIRAEWWAYISQMKTRRRGSRYQINFYVEPERRAGNCFGGRLITPRRAERRLKTNLNR